MHMLATADGGLGLTPTMGQYTIQLVLSHANMAEVSTQSMERDDRDTTRWAKHRQVKSSAQGPLENVAVRLPEDNPYNAVTIRVCTVWGNTKQKRTWL